MNNNDKVHVPNTLYIYIRDLVFAALIGGLILKSIKNGEKIASIDTAFESHIYWSEWVTKGGLRDIEKLKDRINILEDE